LARRPIDIEKALMGSAKALNPQVSMAPTPFRGAFYQPHAQLISQVESEIDDLKLRFSLLYARDANVLSLYCANHGLVKDQGRPSTTQGVYYCYALPPDGEVVFIPQGSVVRTPDSAISFQTVQDINVQSSAFPGLYNNTTKRYEIAATVQSMGIGQDYQVVANRLKMVDPIPFIDGFQQITDSTISTSEETDASLFNRQQTKFVGSSQGLSSGIESLILNFDPSNIFDVTVVYSTETDLFKRPVGSPSYDVYILGNDIQSYTQDFSSFQSTQSFVPDMQPVTGITSITIDGVALASPGIYLKKDNRPGYRDSTLSQDKVVLPSPVSAGSSVIITYSHNKLLSDLNDYMTATNINLWKASFNFRTPPIIPVAATIKATTLSTFDKTSIQTDISTALSQVFSINRMGAVYSPSQVRDFIVSNVFGISNLAVTRFQRTDQGGQLLVDTVEALKNEQIILDAANVLITVL
jgi:hypothetical protein